MFKTRGRGVKGSLNNVKKKYIIGIWWLPLWRPWLMMTLIVTSVSATENSPPAGTSSYLGRSSYRSVLWWEDLSRWIIDEHDSKSSRIILWRVNFLSQGSMYLPRTRLDFTLLSIYFNVSQCISPLQGKIFNVCALHVPQDSGKFVSLQPIFKLPSLSRNDPNTALSLKVGNGKDDFVAPLQIFRSFALIILEYFLNIYFMSINNHG